MGAHMEPAAVADDLNEVSVLVNVAQRLPLSVLDDVEASPSLQAILADVNAAHEGLDLVLERIGAAIDRADAEAGGQPRERDLLALPAHAEVVHEGGDGRFAVRPGRAERTDQQQPGGLATAQQRRDQVERRVVGPVQVLEHEDDRLWRPIAVNAFLLLASASIFSASRRFMPKGHSEKTAFPASRAMVTSSR